MKKTVHNPIIGEVKIAEPKIDKPLPRIGTVQIDDPILKPYFIGQVQTELDLKQNISSAFTQTIADGLYKPIGYTPDLTGQPISNISNLQSSLDSKLTKTIADGLYKPIGYTPDLTGQPISNITNLQTTLDSKANQLTTYTKSEVDSALGLKANQSTTYTKSEVDGFLALKQKKIETGLLQDTTAAALTITTTGTFLNIGTFSGSFYSSSGSIITINKSGWIKVRFQFTVDSSASVGLYLSLFDSLGANIPNSLRLVEATTTNKEINIFYESSVLSSSTFQLKIGATAAGVTMINPTPVATPTGFTGATGYRWKLWMEFQEN